MIRIRAHFDGKVIVPDEPVELSPNAPLEVTVHPMDDQAGQLCITDLRGILRGTWGSAEAVDRYLNRERDSWDN